MDLVKLLVVIALVGIVASLGSALYHLSSNKGDSRKMVRALTIRVGLSVGLFVLLMVAWKFGLIQPHGIGQ
jgi:cytochrome bd-type quinol oxidase subunit 2